MQGWEVMAVMQGWEVMAGHAGLGKDFFEISSEMFGGMGSLYYPCGVN